VERDDRAEILGATEEMLRTLVAENEIEEGDAVSALFTVTEDLRTAFPAEAARRMGWTSTPLMCAREIPVPGALPRCIRVLLHVHTDRTKEDIRHVYLREARSLRPDLVKEGDLK